MIPTYNQASLIGKAIESAIAQDYPNLEIIVADDCSADNTEEVVKKYLANPIVLYKKNSQNLGRVGNYRHCLYHYASAEWVINLDGDDYYINPSFISQAMKKIADTKMKDIFFYQGAHIYKKNNNEEFHWHHIKQDMEILTTKEYFFRYLKIEGFSHMSTVFNRAMAIKYDFYNSNLVSADIYSFLRGCLHEPEAGIILEKNISGVWLQHTGNASGSTSFKTHWKNFKLYIALYKEARLLGYKSIQCFYWLVKAAFLYLRIYVGLFVRKVK